MSAIQLFSNSNARLIIYLYSILESQDAIVFILLNQRNVVKQYSRNFVNKYQIKYIYIPKIGFEDFRLFNIRSDI